MMACRASQNRQSIFARVTRVYGVRQVTFFSLIMSLTGCVVGPDYRKPAMMTPAKWSQSSGVHDKQHAELAGWWRQLNDPLLDRFVSEAIGANTDVAGTKARVREARASLWSARGTLAPTLDGAASYSRSRSGGGPENGQYRAGLDSSWEIDLFGANRRIIEAAKYGLDAAEEDLRATMVTLIGDVATNYVEARGLQAKITLARESAASQRRTAQLTRDKFAAGAVSQLDVSNAEGQAASTEAGIPQMEAQLAASIHRLSVLTGKPPTALNDTMKQWRKIPVPKWPIPSGIPADILLTRPDVRLAERQYAQKTAQIGAREAARYPALTLTGNISTSAAQFGDLGRTSTISWAFGPSLSIPIFNGGRREAAVEMARAQRDQSFIAYRAAILSALEEVENSLVSMTKERLRSGKLAQASRSYRQALDLSQNLYRSGNTSFLELLQAERSHYSAQQSYIDSRVAITQDYIALMKALGGGWDGAVDVSQPEVVDHNTGPHIQTRNTN